MSIATHTAGTAGSTGPVPGLGLALGLDSPSQARGKAQDFATVMRDLPPPASDKARQAVAKHADKRPDTSGQDEVAEAQDVETTAVSEDETKDAKPHRADKADEKGEKKPVATPDQPSEPVVAALAAPLQPVADVPAETVDEAVAAADGEKAKKPVQAPTALPQVTDEGEAPLKEAFQAAAKGAIETGKTETGRANVVQPEVKAGPAIKDMKDGSETGKTSDVVARPSEAKAPAKPGEATELLSLAKGKAEPAAQAKAAEVTLPPQAKAPAASAPEGGDVVESEAVETKPAVAPVRGQGLVTPQGKTIEGLQNAAAKAAPNAAVVERVAAAQASDANAPVTKASSSPSAKAFEPPHVSALALAAADVAQKGTRDGQEKDSSRTAGLLGDVAASAGRGDASSLLTRLEALGGGAMPPQVNAISSLGAAGANGLAGSLGQQVIDMGVSGQWIEDIAQQIARVADNPGQGAFRVSSPSLGPVQVNITPGSQGANIAMTVESEAARAALANDRQRLVQDAQLASVRIGEVRIDRVAALGEAHRGDMNQNGQQGQNGAQHNGGQAALSQGNGQQTRGDASAMGQQTGQDSTKNPFTKAVINDAAASDRANSGKDKRGDNARYA